MHSLAHRARQRRLERSTLSAAGNINLVPLVDILTSIVFFSLLTYRGELLAQLTAYDLTLPPALVMAPAVAPPDRAAELRLVVRVDERGIGVTHPRGGVERAVAGRGSAALDTLAAVAAGVRRRFPEAREARVVPADGVVYDDVVHVLERLRAAGFTAISLGGAAEAGAVARP